MTADRAGIARRAPMCAVTVSGLPLWVDAARLLGESSWAMHEVGRDAGAQPPLRVATAQLAAAEAANLAARLRGVNLGGQQLQVDVDPPLPRKLVREARLQDARRRRQATPGFTRTGVRLDPTGKVSLTPEALALALAQRLAQQQPDATVIEVGSGAGGNAIGFARAHLRVISIEQDAARLALARHNAQVYGVSDRIQFIHGDAEQQLPALRGDLLFIDAPWGVDWNRSYTSLPDLPLLAAVHGLFLRHPTLHRLWAKVPPSFEPASLTSARAEAWFGCAPGDRQRVKFLLLEALRS